MKGTKAIIQAVILTIAAVGQIILMFVLFNEKGNAAVRTAGWVILIFSSVFGWFPIYTLKKWGGVPKGKSYMKTTRVVDRGLYAIVRHPQYFAGILLGLGLALVAQHWLVAALGIIVMVICYMGMFEEDRSALAKYGEAYQRYMDSVPRANPFLGIWLRLRRGK
jgi:protein-S-isoprenylcysteine O-methyltransferase Ste14